MGSMDLLDLMEPEVVPGRWLDRYEILREVGRGGMGSVWLGRLAGKHGFEQLVAIKTLLPALARDTRFRTMFLDEVRVASRIRHPNVVQVFELGETDGVLFVVMEWVEGASLRSWHTQSQAAGVAWPENVVLRVFADACAGLHAAHEVVDDEGAPLGVVHRDTSPHNIMLSDCGIARLIDFGVAKAADRLQGETTTGHVKGKMSFMAPEQYLARDADRRSDIWALGASLHWLLTGESPYESSGSRSPQLAAFEWKGVSPRIRQVVPPRFAPLLERSLARDPGERYATADEFQRAIEATLFALGTPTTHRDVADFLADSFASSVEQRRSVLRRAARSAGDRERMQAALGSGVAEASPSASEPTLTDEAAGSAAVNAARSADRHPFPTSRRRAWVLWTAVIGSAVVGLASWRWIAAPSSVAPLQPVSAVLPTPGSGVTPLAPIASTTDTPGQEPAIAAPVQSDAPGPASSKSSGAAKRPEAKPGPSPAPSVIDPEIKDYGFP
jgi:serine/threonine-protein kinase